MIGNKFLLGIVLLCLIITSCNQNEKNSSKFKLVNLTNAKGFSFKKNKFGNEELTYNGFTLKVKNNSGIDITKAYVGSNIKIKIGEVEWNLTCYDREIEMEQEISESKPWRNGETIDVKIGKFEGVETNKYTLINYPIKEVKVNIEAYALNRMLKYEFYALEKPIATINLTDELVSFVQTIK